MSRHFNIRIYGLLINDLKQVLVSDECRDGFSFTKFPGGGLEFGEGIKDALSREFMEELNIEIEIGDLFYINEFYQESAFNPAHQLISFYYLVHFENWQRIEAGKHEFPLCEDGEKYRWVNISDLDPGDITFPIDKLVCSRLKLEF